MASRPEPGAAITILIQAVTIARARAMSVAAYIARDLTFMRCSAATPLSSGDLFGIVGSRLVQRGRKNPQGCLEVGRVEKTEAQSEDPRLVAKPGAVCHPDAGVRGDLVEPNDSLIIEGRRLEPHAADRTGVGPDPFDVAVIPRNPVRGLAQTLGKPWAPLTENAIALLQDVKGQRLIDWRAA